MSHSLLITSYHSRRLRTAAVIQPIVESSFPSKFAQTPVSDAALSAEDGYDEEDPLMKSRRRRWHRYNRRRVRRLIVRIGVYIIGLWCIYAVVFWTPWTQAPTGWLQNSLSRSSDSPVTTVRQLDDAPGVRQLDDAPGVRQLNDAPGVRHCVSNGLLHVDMKSSLHPIYQLIQEAKEKWSTLSKSQSRTLKEAVDEYRRRYKRQPPAGFDKWWAYVVEHNVQLPDEYDQILRDLSPFFAFTPHALFENIEATAILPDTYTVQVAAGALYNESNFDNDHRRGGQRRVEGQVELLQPVAQYLPDLKAVYSVHDTPSQFISYAYRQELFDRIEDEDYISASEEVDESMTGWQAACSSSQNSKSDHAKCADTLSDSPSFIKDHRQYFDLCKHPEHVSQQSALSARPPRSGPLKPMFSLSKTALHADILVVPTEQYESSVANVPWDAKIKSKMLWRGTNTGASYHAEHEWRNGQRMRLVALGAGRPSSAREVLPAPLNIDGQALGDITTQIGGDVLGAKYLDVAFAGVPIQCNEADGTCDQFRNEYEWATKMSISDSLKYKYVIDTDGNAWSARFQRLLMSGSLVFKSTIMPEWWTDRIQPWVHYVPAKIDYTDLFDLITFFRGDLSGEGGEDDLAREIAENGKKWAQTYWRKEDMTAYMFRLYLEYGRLASHDRSSMDFVYDPSMEMDHEGVSKDDPGV